MRALLQRWHWWLSWNEVMTQNTKALVVLAALSPSAIWFASDAVAQQKSLKDQLVGSWTLVAMTDASDAKKPKGGALPNLKTVATFAPDGGVTWTVERRRSPAAARSPPATASW